MKCDEMFSIKNHKALVNKALRDAMICHGITKDLLENEQVKHKFFVSFRSDRNSICLAGEFSCPELWDVLGKPEHGWFPVSQYVPGNLIRIDGWFLEFETKIDENSIEIYFEELVRDAIKPIVSNMQTPIESVRFFKQHRSLLSFGPALKDRYFAIWSQHFGLN